MGGNQPMGPGDIILEAFRICGERVRDLLKVTATAVLPVTIFGLLLVATFTPTDVMRALNGTLPEQEVEAAFRAIPTADWVSLGLAFAVFAVLSGLAYLVAMGGCITIALDHVGERSSGSNGRSTSAEALRRGVARLAPMLWISILSGLAVLVGLLLCIVPGVALYVSFIAAPVALFAEDRRGRRALSRSRRLLKTRWWPSFLVILLEMATLFTINVIGGSLPPLLLPGAVESNAFALFFTTMLIGTIAGLVGIALHAAITTVLFLDLRKTAEPPARLGVPPPPPPPLPAP